MARGAAGHPGSLDRSRRQAARGLARPRPGAWSAATAGAHLSRDLTPDGVPCDLFALLLEALADGGMAVALA
ncbi:hypothetical protein [Streptomyces malaysiense]|uniref:Uncharacterized protein n=1 Tax=Streptomyces malaysiense TaxID=1428626 RepID=A0A1J4Q528_9ACTN|nr:hypothetical protein VT52_006410 [Streptomyces malaysiense]